MIEENSARPPVDPHSVPPGVAEQDGIATAPSAEGVRGATTYDASGLEPLSDAEFWPVIDLLGGRFWQKTIESTERELARRDDQQILRWEETVGLKALALDNVIDFGVDALWAIGATIGKGQVIFEAVLADADVFEPKWMNDNSWSVLTIGSGALWRRHGEVEIVTSFTPTRSRLFHLAYPDLR